MDDEVTSDAREYLEKRKVELTKILESFESLEKAEEWNTLKELFFNKSLESVKRQIIVEATLPEVNLNKIYKLQGELVWAKRLTNLNEFIESLKRELEVISKKLK